MADGVKAGQAPVRVLTAGMVGSGSTYLFNVAREILARDRRLRTVATYSDEWSKAFLGQHHLVLKSHWGLRALLPVAAGGILLPVVSLRHPGDCVCSDIERFGFDFAFALKRVALSLAFARQLSRTQGALMFRYEDRFTDSPETAALLAERFGLKLPGSALAEISRKYDAAQVRAYAAELEGNPDLVTSPDNPRDAWCPRTQIHRGHIGRQSVGRWRDLSVAERARIAEACGDDAALLGYGFDR